MVSRAGSGGNVVANAATALKCRRSALLQLLALPLALPAMAAQARIGRLEALKTAPPAGIAARDVTVWLPPGYDGLRRHAVLYLHDGQMQFDSSSTWNHKSWELDVTAARLLAQQALRPFIIVAIDNDPQRRHAEFFPQKAVALLQPSSLRDAFVAQALGNRPAADDYLRFIVGIVKPAVDARYATLRDRSDTFVMGSSMGGLVSLYALCEYPQVFGGAAALSTHWIGGYERNRQIPAALLGYLERALPTHDRVRLYMDRGTKGLDALYDDAQQQVDTLLHGRGFSAPAFVSQVIEGATHDEDAWAARADQPLRLLLG